MLEKRDPIFDVLKGIGIILVVLGHCDFVNVDQIVFSFHMPLFFFISGYFAKKRNVKDELYISFRRLIVPFFSAFAILFMLSFVWDVCFGTNFLGKTMVTFLLGCKDSMFAVYFQEPPYAGPLWFFFALFEVRIFYSVFYKYSEKSFFMFVFSVFMAIFAQFMVRNFGQLPLFVFPSMGSFGFFYVGTLLNRYDILNTKKINCFAPYMLVCWGVCMSFSKMGLHDNIYELFYIVDLFGALGAFLVCVAFVRAYWDGTGFFWRCLQYIGRISIFCLFVHSIDHTLFYRWSLFWGGIEFTYAPYGRYLVPVFRIAIMVCIAYCLDKSEWIKKNIFFVNHKRIL